MNASICEDVKFPTSDSYTADDIKKVQQELLAMAKIVTQIFEEHGIPYFIAFGTLIGAVKFQGFLPWDDDIDLFLFDESYDEAIDLLERLLPDYLIVHGEKNDPNYFLAWNSVKNINTSVEIADVYHTHNRLLGYKCLGIDLYKLKKVYINEVDSYKKEEAINFFFRKYNKGLIDKFQFDNELEKLQALEEKVEQESIKDLDAESKREVFYFVVKVNKPIAIDDVLPLKKIDFEDAQFYSPNNPIAVLSASFDNLDRLPEYKMRKTHLQSVSFIKN